MSDKSKINTKTLGVQNPFKNASGYPANRFYPEKPGKLKPTHHFDKHHVFLADEFEILFIHPMNPVRWSQWRCDHHKLWNALVEHVGGVQELLTLKNAAIFPNEALVCFMENCGIREQGYPGILDPLFPELRPGYNWEAQTLLDFLTWYTNRFFHHIEIEEEQPKKRGWPKGRPRGKKKEDDNTNEQSPEQESLITTTEEDEAVLDA